MIRSSLACYLLVACSSGALPDTTGAAGHGGATIDTGGAGAGTGGAGGAMDCSQLSDSCNVGRREGTDCIASPRPHGTPCDDGLACTALDVCVDGACVSGGPVACPAPDPCSVAACNETTALCEVTPATEGTACEDGDICTVGEVCTGGICSGGAPNTCGQTSDICRVYHCDQVRGCVSEPAHIDEICGDSSFECDELRCDNDGFCSYIGIFDCINGDDCCPGGRCDSTNDSDCEPRR